LNKIGNYRIKNITTLILQREVFDPLIKAKFKEGLLISIYRRINVIFSFAAKNELLDRKRFSTPNVKSAVESIKRDAISIKDIEINLEIALNIKLLITHVWASYF
jgi:hypothetical protein